MIKLFKKQKISLVLMNSMISLFIIWYVLVMNLVNFIKRQNLPSKINMIKIQLKNGYVYSTGVSLVNNLNVVVSPMVQKLDLSLYHLVVIGVCQVMPMFKYGLMKSKEFRTACSSFFINSVFYPFNKSFH